jgi:hypothetical protein
MEGKGGGGVGGGGPGGGERAQEPPTAEQRARSKWSSSREKTDRRMSSFSDCAVDPKPVATPTPLRRLGTGLPLRTRLPLASIAGALRSRAGSRPDQTGQCFILAPAEMRNFRIWVPIRAPFRIWDSVRAPLSLSHFRTETCEFFISYVFSPLFLIYNYFLFFYTCRLCQVTVLPMAIVQLLHIKF